MAPADDQDDLDHRPRPRTRRVVLAYLLFGLIPVVFLACWACGTLLQAWSGQTYVIGIGIGIAFLVNGWFFTLGRRLLQPMSQSRELVQRHRPHVLFLRSFRDDQTGVLVTDTYEEHIASALRGIGRLRAVGKPGEKLAPAGIDRIYLEGDDWRGQVERSMQSARFVIIQHGLTAGLLLELQKAIHHLPAHRLLISLPIRLKPKQLPDWITRSKAPSRQALYDQFRRETTGMFPRPLPDSIGGATFLYFDEDWTPRLLEPARWHTYFLFPSSTIRETLRPFCARLGIQLGRTRTVRDVVTLLFLYTFFLLTLGCIACIAAFEMFSFAIAP